MIESMFPFPAIVGQEKVKKGILLNIINPNIGGLLISGEKGTGKSTIIRSVGTIAPWIDIVDLPLNITEDRLIGSIDMEKAIQHGEKAFEPGLFQQAHENILYIDEVNLLSDNIVNSILQVSSSGVNRVEREGISYSHLSKFVLVGSMNPEEGRLKSQFIEKFGLYVQVEGEKDIEERKEIIKRRLEYEGDNIGFFEKWKEECRRLQEKLKTSMKLLGEVSIPKGAMNSILDVVNAYNCQGNRTEIVMVETVRALAALSGRKEAEIIDVKEAIQFVLPHRASRVEEPKRNQEKEDNREKDNRDRNENKEEGENPPNKDELENILDNLDDIDFDKPSSDDESVERIGETFKPRKLEIKARDRKYRKGSGKRSNTRTNLKQGRYVRYRYINEKVSDISFDGTLRAAAPYQKVRDKDGVALAIEKSDLREKVREKRTGTTVIFAVDASGSICANKRMEAVKGAIMSLLADAYEKRDKVAMVAFRKESAEVLLQTTRSVDLAEKCLRDLPAGGKTPLSMGLSTAYGLIKGQSIKDKEMIPLLVLVSDGRANVSMTGEDPLKEAMKIGEKIGLEGIRSIVIDTESGFVKFGVLKKLACVMGADYFKIDNLNDKYLANTVRKIAAQQ